MEKSAPVVFKHDCDACIPLSRPNWYWCPSSVKFSHGTLLRRDSDEPSDYLSYTLEVIENAVKHGHPLGIMREMFEEVCAVEEAAAANKREENEMEISAQPDPAPGWEQAAKLLANQFAEIASAEEITSVIDSLADFDPQVRFALTCEMDKEVPVRVLASGGGEISITFSVETEYFDESVTFEFSEVQEVAVPVSELDDLDDSSAVRDFFEDRASEIETSVGNQFESGCDVTFEFESFEREG